MKRDSLKFFKIKLFMPRFLCAALIIALLTGCTGQGVEVDPSSRVEPPTPAPAPTPTPTPQPINVLFVTDNDAYAAYIDCVEGLADGRGALAQHSSYEKGMPINGYKALLFLKSNEETELEAVERAIREGIPAAVLDLTSGEPIEGASYLSYSPGDIAGFALDECLAYPPHDTPVRLIGLFEKKHSPGDDAYKARIDEGKIFDRGIYYKAQGEDAGAFLNERLDRYVEGLTDAIIVEGTELFKTVINVLNDRGRTDMEVFLIPEGTLSEQQAYYKAYIFPLAMGADIEGQLAMLFNQMMGVLEGQAPKAGVFKPSAADMSAVEAAR